jgi:alanine racemase
MDILMGQISRCRNAWVEIDTKVLCRNLDAVRAALKPGTGIILVVKANAYGHGMATVAAAASECGVRGFLVARLDEALALRSRLPLADILLLGAVWPVDVPELHRHRIVPVLVSEEQARAIGEAVVARGLPALNCHLKIDTGMGRFGVNWENAADVIGRLRSLGGLALSGACMHFASAGKPGDAFALVQGRRFAEVVARAGSAPGAGPLFRHMANSAAFLSHGAWDMDAVRLGILAYGYGGRSAQGRARTEPFLQWKTRVIQVKRVPAGFPVGYLSTHVTSEPTSLATIDVGYSDGFPRLMSNKGQVLVGGRRARVVGRVTMNFTTVDVGPDSGARAGDEVVLIGRQGGESLWADDLARWCQTIPYEILTNIRSEPRPDPET